MILNDILAQRRKDLDELKERFPLHRLKQAAETKMHEVRSFKKALSNPKKINLICELKKASPSEGVIREDFQPLRLAAQLEFAGASALSILTESRYFKGRPSYMKTVRQVTHIPLLRKDFLFESYQIYETAILEADAFLLISSILTKEELRHLIELGQSLRMEALVEVHNNEDLKKALDAGAEIIGINNRDLRTFEVDPLRAQNLLPHIPKDRLVVIESGLKTHDEIMSYKSLGVHVFLIGTTLMRAPDLITAVHSLLGPQAQIMKGK